MNTSLAGTKSRFLLVNLEYFLNNPGTIQKNLDISRKNIDAERSAKNKGVHCSS